jgi:hypothetical protein
MDAPKMREDADARQGVMARLRCLVEWKKSTWERRNA